MGFKRGRGRMERVKGGKKGEGERVQWGGDVYCMHIFFFCCN